MQRNTPDVIIKVDNLFMWKLEIGCDAIS